MGGDFYLINMREGFLLQIANFYKYYIIPQAHIIAEQIRKATAEKVCIGGVKRES
ncbi:hypothetical protein SpAn4DRAFT_0981 [Sporomusa ovata]|uniref:Uncharacterized protein n=1 Tax=Sporomusa ovata TaxID=2378 RepID=A0A0U1L5D3_9FIRM|nr:hypothetical protein SpAn4DRAFT_0981 [Sporomusa ovata]